MVDSLNRGGGRVKLEDVQSSRAKAVEATREIGDQSGTNLTSRAEGEEGREQSATNQLFLNRVKGENSWERVRRERGF
jgi:hypothetical protein